MAFPATDVDVLGNGMLIMRTVEVGEVSQAKPVKGDTVEILIKVLLVDGENHKGQGVRSFRLGEGDECDAFECVMPLMRPREVCAVRSIPRAFGLDHELCLARPTAAVEAVVQLLKVTQLPAVTERSLAERIAEAKKKKSRGNAFFTREEFQAAAVSFSLGLSYVREDCHKHMEEQQKQEWASARSGDTKSQKDGDDDSELKDAVAVCCSLYTNLALVQLKLPEQESSAVETCNAALALQRDNVKALYLRAKALLGAKRYKQLARQEAIETLDRVLELAPDNEDAKQLLESAADDYSAGRSQMKTMVYIIISGFLALTASDLYKWIFPPSMPIPGDNGWMRGDDVDINITGM